MMTEEHLNSIMETSLKPTWTGGSSTLASWQDADELAKVTFALRHPKSRKSRTTRHRMFHLSRVQNCPAVRLARMTQSTNPSESQTTYRQSSKISL